MITNNLIGNTSKKVDEGSDVLDRFPYDYDCTLPCKPKVFAAPSYLVSVAPEISKEHLNRFQNSIINV